MGKKNTKLLKLPRKIILLVIFLLLAALTAGLFLAKLNNKKESRVCFKDNCFNVELALTGEEKEQGLMFRKDLDQNRGMLFVFEEDGEYPFWMKNTLISLDIIWIDKNKEVVFINENSPACWPAELCPVINPGKKARYVLELNGGTAAKVNLSPGSKVVFDKIR